MLFLTLRRFVVLVLVGVVSSCSHPQRMLDAQDKHAAQQSTQSASALVQLAGEITALQPSEEGKVRVLFDWIGNNISYPKNVAATTPTAETVFAQKSGDAKGRALLFEAMATASGLEAKTIEGKSKGYSFDLEALHDHTWNACKIKGEWKLLDLTWSHGHVANDGTFVVEKDDSWFCPDPTSASYFNLPNEKTESLLSSPLEIDEFVARPRLLPAFFTQGLDFEQPGIGVMESSTELITRLRSGKGALLEAEVRPIGGEFLWDACRVVNDSGTAAFEQTFPSKGVYEVQIKAKLPTQKESRYVGSYYVRVTPAVISSAPSKQFAVPSRRPTPKVTPSAAPKTLPTISVEDGDVARVAKEITKSARTDKDKAYALYRWLGENVAYDTHSYFNLKNTEYPDQSAQAVLKRKSSVCAGYANLFEEMAKAVGLEAEVISGFTQGDEYNPNRKFKESDHAWNAVKIDGKWQLLDSTWGAGSVSNQTQQFTRAPHDGWFLSPPEQFLYSHLPDDSKWQLVEHPISSSEFNQLPNLKPLFFEYGLELSDNKKGVLTCKDHLSFSVKSRKNTDLNVELEDINGNRIDNSVLFHKSNRSYEIRVRPPHMGTYKLLFFGKHNDEESQHLGSILLTAKGAAKTTFPLTYSNYSENNIQLIRGEEGEVQAGKPFTIELKGKNAKGFTVVQDDKRVAMSQVLGDSYEATFTPKRGEFGVTGNFDGKNWYVLKYTAK